MDEKGFRKFIKEGKRVPKGLSEKTIRSHIRMVKEFERSLKSKGPKRQFNDATERDVKSFIRLLAKDNRNTFDNLIGLLRYSRFSGNGNAELALLIALDGGNIFGLLCDTVKEKYGKQKYDELLGDFKPPGIGTSFKMMPRVTKKFMNRLESGIGEEETRAALLTGPHAGPPELYAIERRLLKSSKNVDEYLRKRRKEFMDVLRDHMDNGTLFFTQKINQDVLDFLKRNPEFAGGVRRGNMIYSSKMPYMTIEFLKEKDPTMKRYYCCHCPLARESILSGESISRNFCYCSAGYEKRPFDVAFGKPVKAEVTKSVLWGDPICQFVIEIPEEYRVGKARRGG